jgi:hypothetical protein
VGVGFVGDYMLLTEDQDDADAFAEAAEAAPLEDDPAFGGWTDRVGDPGVVTMYASAEAPRLLVEAGRELGQEDLGMPFLGLRGDRMGSLWKDFDGMAAVVRFSDGSMEAELAARGLPAGVASTPGRTGPSLADLPRTTAAALTVSLPEGWLQGYLDAVGGMLGSSASLDAFWGAVEADTDLRLPEDVEALLGAGVSLSVDSSVDLEGLTVWSEIPDAPVALRIAGDPGEVTRVLDILTDQLGADGDMVVVEQTDDLVVVGLQQEYVDSLLGGGTLGELEAFRSVVPDPDRASGALFVNFDAGDGWLDALAEGEEEVAANLAPLDALGMSSWREDDVQHGLVRLTTD